MWTTIAAILCVVAIIFSALAIQFSWRELKALFMHTGSDLKSEKNRTEEIVIDVVGYSKLWFRKQFPIIDKELQSLPVNTLRTGLIAIREEFDESQLRRLLSWQINTDLSERVTRISMLRYAENLTGNIGVLIAFSALILNLTLHYGTAQVEFSLMSLLLPALITVVFAFFAKALVLMPLISRLEQRLDQEEQALNLCCEGLLLLHQKRTPAVVRDTLEAMMHGLTPSTSIPKQIPPSAAQFFRPQRAG